MFYIHQTKCISAQLTWNTINLNELQLSQNNILPAKEPSYDSIPPAMFRRMGKAVRLSSGAALPLLHQQTFNGIVIGTANGGLEDCIKFLNQIIQYEEGRLTPTNFVQSTTNAIASQLAFFSANKGHNSTHVHRGLAFENALLEVAMLLTEHPQNNYLAGGVDEISAYQNNIELLSGSYKKEEILNTNLYTSNTPGSIPGEGCVMFALNKVKENATAHVKAISTLHSEKEEDVLQHLKDFIKDNPIDLILSGEGGDNRFTHFYTAVETVLPNKTIARFKHLCGEYTTASSFALWFACSILQTNNIPAHALKKEGANKPYKNILIYNNYMGKQHSFMLVTV
ncbi:MAG: beta-ketoacyl synthase chain length factor [Bacteroidia bacterium]